jgi:hypothetical protein
MPVKAFIGEPADRHGNALPCARCDRRATARVGGELRCSWHLTEALPAAVRRGLQSAHRDRTKRKAFT